MAGDRQLRIRIDDGQGHRSGDRAGRLQRGRPRRIGRHAHGGGQCDGVDRVGVPRQERVGRHQGGRDGQHDRWHLHSCRVGLLHRPQRGRRLVAVGRHHDRRRRGGARAVWKHLGHARRVGRVVHPERYRLGADRGLRRGRQPYCVGVRERHRGRHRERPDAWQLRDRHRNGEPRRRHAHRALRSQGGRGSRGQLQRRRAPRRYRCPERLLQWPRFGDRACGWGEV